MKAHHQSVISSVLGKTLNPYLFLNFVDILSLCCFNVQHEDKTPLAYINQLAKLKHIHFFSYAH